MTTEENAKKTSECSFNGCGEMMKMMSRCMGGKDEKIDFKNFFAKMPDCCKEMMKKCCAEPDGAGNK
jgi:hypothetical protein